MMDEILKKLSPNHLLALRQLSEGNIVLVEIQTLVELQQLGLASRRVDSHVESPLTFTGRTVLEHARKTLRL